ncbi:hypothetical protein GHT07_06380 [Caenimonas koreensis DSM 17982]|uniref:Uncharacterized protein n=1 Tax=Caenimonas koreensis DSM 17982 TaxID=1121255 RepID=A0A844ARL7_9BURK|nr:hypothetical protein [Caenimonas koreensis DSM 17982]
MISWLFPSIERKKVTKPQLPDSSGLSRMDPTRPVGRAGAKEPHPVSNGQPANRKNERMARRELLYSVVRDAMMRAGVLSASYKFKVLSLDPRGRQFLVMVDLARDFGGETMRLAEIEAMIAQGAKSRHDILVTAVYWRINEHVAVGDPQAAPSRARAGTPSSPMPLESQPAPLESAPAALLQPAAAHGAARYEPLLADEVAAFKQALAAGASPREAASATSAAAVAQKAAVAGMAASAAASAAQNGVGPGANHGATARAFDGSAKHGPQSYTLLTGFEDTEMPETSGERAPLLSGTQYGELN